MRKAIKQEDSVTDTTPVGVSRCPIDIAKLGALRDKHARLHTSYKASAELARDLAKAASLLVSEIAAEADTEHALVILNQSPEDLAAVPMDAINAARIDPRAVRRLIVAKKASAKQRAEADAMAEVVKASAGFIDRVNTYAQRFEGLL